MVPSWHDLNKRRTKLLINQHVIDSSFLAQLLQFPGTGSVNSGYETVLCNSGHFELAVMCQLSPAYLNTGGFLPPGT